MIKLKKKKVINIKNNIDRIDFNLLKPIFSFEFLQNNFNFKNRKELQSEHYKIFLYKIETLSKLTWLEIIRLPRENGIEILS